MTHPSLDSKSDLGRLTAAADRSARAIPPLWPLASSVAVNPFLGQTGEGLSTAAARLCRVAGAPLTMPRSWYHEQICSGEITQDDLFGAWRLAPADLRPADLVALKSQAAREQLPLRALPTASDLAAEISGMDWPGLLTERIGAWAAGHFDEGQALWAAPRGKGAYASWRVFATHDLTPEIVGLCGFARHVSETPESALGAIARAVETLGLSDTALETFFHQMLMTMGGWAQLARCQMWQAELGGGTDQTLTELLAIRLVWEEALFLRYGSQIGHMWADVCATHEAQIEATPELVTNSIFQEAAERSAQRKLSSILAMPARQTRDERPLVQAAFCIDVRSEVFRRALETLNPKIQTLGFAGFFGVTTSHRRFASDVEELRLPVLLKSAFRSCSGGSDLTNTDLTYRFKARAKRAWGRFKLAAVSSFAFVEATGPIYIGKLLTDALRLNRISATIDPAPHFEPALDLATRIKTAETILRAMSLTKDFARLVILAGHGTHLVNNPHASALQCGACGGFSGEVNARLLASVLNDPSVRAGLTPHDIVVPPDTLFIAALHDTTTDQVTLYEDQPCETHKQDIGEARAWLSAAGRLARGERALRLPRAGHEGSLHKRNLDWAETRPEWALAGCKFFIAARQSRTAGKNLEGKAFLHTYDYRQDKAFDILELIMTAPVVVASWISLQYYGSTVAPDVFGAGNKLLHNVIGGIGVVEGNGGLLRAGLPWQSVHDGQNYVHEPLRLSVCIEAPCEAMTDILRRHSQVRALFDNRWLHLFALDEHGRMAWRYAGDLQWMDMENTEFDETQSLASEGRRMSPDLSNPAFNDMELT